MEGAEGDGGGDVGGGGGAITRGTKTLVCVLTLGVAAMTDTPRVEEMVLRGVATSECAALCTAASVALGWVPPRVVVGASGIARAASTIMLPEFNLSDT